MMLDDALLLGLVIGCALFIAFMLALIYREDDRC